MPSTQTGARQTSRALTIAFTVAASAAPVAFASFAGPTGAGYDRTAGNSAIYAADGSVIAAAGGAPGELVTATVPRRVGSS